MTKDKAATPARKPSTEPPPPKGDAKLDRSIVFIGDCADGTEQVMEAPAPAPPPKNDAAPITGSNGVIYTKPVQEAPVPAPIHNACLKDDGDGVVGMSDSTGVSRCTQYIFNNQHNEVIISKIADLERKIQQSSDKCKEKGSEPSDQIIADLKEQLMDVNYQLIYMNDHLRKVTNELRGFLKWNELRGKANPEWMGLPFYVELISLKEEVWMFISGIVLRNIDSLRLK